MHSQLHAVSYDDDRGGDVDDDDDHGCFQLIVICYCQANSKHSHQKLQKVLSQGMLRLAARKTKKDIIIKTVYVTQQVGIQP